MSTLTAGAIRRTFDNQTDFNPIVQVLEIKKLAAAGQNAGPSADRYRLVISDGEHYQQAMLATQLNAMVNEGSLKDHTVIQLKEFICNVVHQRRIVIILNLQVISEADATIGNPVNIEQVAKAEPTMEETRPAAGAPRPPAYMQKSYTPSASAPAAGFSASTTFHPIASLNPYQNRWTIKARVTAKSEIRHWNNNRGEGKLFSIDLLDSQGGQIRATMFKDACDKFYDVFQVDKVYIISKGQLKLSQNKKFSRIPNEYELTLNSDAEVQYVGEDESIESQKFTFTNVEQINQKQNNDYVDIIGVVTAVAPVSRIVAKATQKEMTKRSLTITDMTLNAVELTLWGDQAEKFNESVLANNPVIAVKGCRVSDFGGRSLSTSFNSQIFVNPDRPEAARLRAWWEEQGASANVENISKKGGSAAGGPVDSRKYFSAIKEEQLGFHEKPDYFTVRGTITYFKHEFEKPPWYTACPGWDAKANRECGRRVTGSNGGWHCAYCDKDYPNMNPRYVLSLLAADATGATWLSAFNQEAETLLRKKAEEMLMYKEMNNNQAFEQVFQEANFKSYVFKCRASADKQSDEVRVRCHVIGIKPVDFREESKNLLAEIEKYN